MTLFALLVGCNWFRTPPDCQSPDQVVAEADGQALTCADLAGVDDYIQLLSLRTLLSADRGTVAIAMVDDFHADPVASRARVTGAEAVVTELRDATGIDAADKRGVRAWEFNNDKGPFATGPDAVRNLLADKLSVWLDDDDSRLVLTEMDVEGWIRYASLCREAQGGSPLRVSIGDRVGVYRMLEDRFAGYDRDGKVGVLAVGAFWWAIHDRWQEAPYEVQQEWIARAPLPPPMNATSLGYVDTLIAGDLPGHAREVHSVLGPLKLQPAPP